MSNITKQENAELAMMEGITGLEEVDNTMMVMPRAKLLQQTSPEVLDGVEGAKAGAILNTLFGEVVNPVFAPLKVWTTRTMFVPRNDAGKFWETTGLEEQDTPFVCRAKVNQPDPVLNPFNHKSCANCKYKDFGWDGQPDTKPLCTHTLNVLALFEGQETPLAFQFFNTNLKYGRRFASMLRMLPMGMYSRKFELTAKQERNNFGVYYTTPVRPAGKAEGEFLSMAKALFMQCNSPDASVIIDDEGMDEDVHTANPTNNLEF